MKKIAIFIFTIFITIQVFSQQKTETIDIIVEPAQMILPDLLVIKIDLKYVEKREQDALNRLNAGFNNQISMIENAGFKKEQIKLEDFSINEISDYESSKPKINGFEAIQSIKIMIPVTEKALIGKLLDTLNIKKTENITISVETQVSDELNKKIRNDLIRKGIADATEKAKIMAESLNLKLGKVKFIEYGDLIFREVLKSSIRFIPPVIRDNNFSAFKSSTYNILGYSETEIRDKIHIVWYIE